MKKIFITTALAVTASITSFAQCDAKVRFTSSKTEYLSQDSTVNRSKEEKSEILFDKTTITIVPGGDKTMQGTIKSVEACNWTVPYKEGKMVFKAALGHDGGETADVTITITGKDGKTTFIAVIDNNPGKRIRLTADKFESQ
jgi:hypothetical protein